MLAVVVAARTSALNLLVAAPVQARDTLAHATCGRLTAGGLSALRVPSIGDPLHFYCAMERIDPGCGTQPASATVRRDLCREAKRTGRSASGV